MGSKYLNLPKAVIPVDKSMTLIDVSPFQLDKHFP